MYSSEEYTRAQWLEPTQANAPALRHSSRRATISASVSKVNLLITTTAYNQITSHRTCTRNLRNLENIIITNTCIFIQVLNGIMKLIETVSNFSHHWAYGNSKSANILNMSLHVAGPISNSLHVLFLKFRACHSTVVLHSSDRSNNDYTTRD